MQKPSPDRVHYSMGRVAVEEGRLAQGSPDLAPTPVAAEIAQRLQSNVPASGRFKRVAVRSGFDVSFLDVTIEKASMSHGVDIGPHLSITVLIEADGRGWMTDRDGGRIGDEYRYRSGTTYVVFLESDISGSYEIPAGTRFRIVDLRLSLDFLESLDVVPLLRQAGSRHHLTKALGEGYWIGWFPTSPSLHRAATAAQELAFDPGQNDLTVEARALDILSEILDVMKRSADRMPGAISGRDLARLAAAKARMLDNLERPWTIAELALEVGLNEKKLKTGFRQQFGSPVHAFLQSARLVRAKELLETGQTSVTEVAHRVGYSNPSHFAKIYRRQFGVSPTGL